MMILNDEAPLQADLINLQDDATNIVLGTPPDGILHLTYPTILHHP